MSQTKALLLTRYDRMGASSRLRFLQFMPWLEAAGITCDAQPFFSDEMLTARYRAGQYRRWAVLHAYWERMTELRNRRSFDLLWIEKEALPWFPATLERAMLSDVPYALDFDDALFHNYDLHRSAWVRHMMGGRLDKVMAGARLVTAGNDYLAQRARDAGAPWVEIVPTVIDLDRYHPRAGVHQPNVPCIVWVGSPSTVTYLSILVESLKALSRRFIFKLRVVGAEFSMPGVDVECVPWSEATEVASIAQCDVGIMPLKDSPWERGKCGYKLIQYMACGLPVVASPVGANVQIVRDGETGFLAGEQDTWEAKLGQLLANAQLRASMGQAGRRRIEAEYCVQQVAPRLAGLLKQAGAC